MKHKYNEQQLKQAVQDSISIRQALMILGMSPKGGNYQVINKAIKQYNIDTSHFLGCAHNRGKRLNKKTPTSDYLRNKVSINSFRLKKRLLDEGIFKPLCSSCLRTHWLNKPIPLELDHKDGDSSNNNLNNLRLLCPNCHAFTPTYRGKNQKRVKA